MMKTLLISIIAFLITIPCALAQITYNGNGNTGFGGVLGSGDITIQDDGTTITVTFNRGADNFNDFIVIYLDTASEGITSTAPVIDFGDSHRKALTTNNVTFSFPPGFTANRAIALNRQFGAIWDVTQNFNNLNFEGTGLVFDGSRANNLPSYTMTFNKSSFGIGVSDNIEFKLVAYYLNPNGGDFDNGFVSNEGIGRGLPATNLGGTEGTQATFQTYFTYPDNLQAGQALSATNGNWDNNSTWINGNPPLTTDTVQIDHNVTLNQNATVSSLTLNSGTFTASDDSARELTISRSAAGSATTITNSGGTWANGTGGSTVVFTGAPSSGDAIHGTSGTIAFQNVTINKIAGTDNVGVDFQTSSSVSGTLKIGNGGFVSTPPPTDFYDTSAILEFDQGVGSTYDVGATDNSWSTTEIPQNITINSGSLNLNANRAATGDLIIANNATLNISAGNNLEINSNLTNDGNIILSSNSDSYSGLIVNSATNNGTITYNRYVNEIGTSAGGGNDLVAPPLGGQAFNDFVNANANLPQNDDNTQAAFAPFNNTTGTYINLAPSASTTLEVGTGYRAATTAGSTLVFTGSAATGTVNVPVSIGTVSPWNLIGNPYPSYLDPALFLSENSTVLDGAYTSIYGYNATLDSGTNQNGIWTIWDNNINGGSGFSSELIAPGQGFFVRPSGSVNITFTPAMRSIGNSDDFIGGRPNSGNFARATLVLQTNSQNFNTNIYFRDINTRGLDPGYDTGAFDQNVNGIFTQLVENNNGINLVNQSLPYNDLSDITVPLTVNMAQGQALNFGLDSNTILPPAINVYLEDTVTETFTLLNNNSYQMTPESALNGTGRFFLRFTSGTLGIGDEMANSLNIYQDTSAQVLVIAGQLKENTAAYIYDLQGRLVQSTGLAAGQLQHHINVSSLQTGIYIVKIGQQITHKVMIR